MNLTRQAEKAKARMTAELQRYVAAKRAESASEPGNRPPVIKPGQWWATHCGDVVRIDSVTWLTVRGTRWCMDSGRMVCYGSSSYGLEGHSIGASYITDNDLARQIAKPEWAEELEQVQ